MTGLHENQKRILEFLLDQPDGSTLDELALRLELSKTATKEHLLKIVSLGLLSHRDTYGNVGRPRRRYILTPSGHETFPRQYSWLSNILLEHLAEEMGGPNVSKIMESLAIRISKSMRARFENTRSTPERLREITKALNELGYRATLRQSDLRKGAVIEATNCVYHSVAKNNPALCRFDTKFIESASGGMDVKLESCIARGGSICRFCIRKRT
jgi:predicted ArsR family transcriptional regulator